MFKLAYEVIKKVEEVREGSGSYNKGSKRYKKMQEGSRQFFKNYDEEKKRFKRFKNIDKVLRWSKKVLKCLEMLKTNS